MKKFIKNNRFIALVLLVSLVCTAVLIGKRIVIESENKRVSIIMTYRDVFKYSDAAGIDEKEALAAFADIGVTGIVVENYWYFFPEKEIYNTKAAGMEPILRTVRDITVEEYDALIKKYDLKYPLYFSYRQLVGDADEYLNENGISLALVENKDQTGNEKIRRFDPNDSKLKMVRVFELMKSFASRYAVLGYKGAEEIENILYRAISDRNIRILWITPFYDSRTGEMVTDIEEYRGVIENLARRALPHGITVGADFSSVESYTPQAPLVLGSFAGICALSVLLLGTLVKISPKFKLVFTAALFALSAAAFFAARTLALKVMAFVCVSVAPCVAVWFLFRCAKKLMKKRPGFFGCILYTAGIFAAMLLILVAGGSFVGAILGESKYMLEFELFRGVKLSQAIPLVYAAIMIAREFVYKKGKSVREMTSELAKNASRSKKLIAVFSVIAILCAAALFIVRTGNTILQAGELEQRFRIFFEVNCVARPRTKEFLIAWPALFAGMLFFSKNRKILGSVALFAASVGCASVCNTFCHIRAYYLLSLMRTGYGAALGLAIGLVLAAVFNLLFRAAGTEARKAKKRQK